jgi:hypothetical protein
MLRKFGSRSQAQKINDQILFTKNCSHFFPIEIRKVAKLRGSHQMRTRDQRTVDKLLADCAGFLAGLNEKR